MNRTFIMMFFAIGLQADSYQNLLNQAVKNNANLEISQSQEQQRLLEGKITTRYKNPNMEFEISDFYGQRNQLGARTGLSQSLLLPEVKRDKTHLSKMKANVAKERYVLKKAEFIYKFSMQYLEYKEALERKTLQEEELSIAKGILEIAQERFSAGASPRSEYLQTRVDYQNAVNQQVQLELKIEQSLNRLFKLANVRRMDTLDGGHTFFRTSKETLHPLLKVVEEQQKVSQAQLRLASHTIQNISFFSEMEKEPDQSIFRLGFSIPLPIFNKKSEEKQLAKIALLNQKIFLNKQKKSLSLELEQLVSETTLLEQVKSKYEGLILEQRDLLSMYQQGYAIAKVNLLKLSDTKKGLIQSKEKIVEASLQIERNIVKMNYLRGAGNE